MRNSTLVLIFSLFLLKVNAQCNTGEIAVTMQITVDAWGQETYWEIVPSGNGCGNGTIASGSNFNVGCAGVDPADGNDGYPDNTLVSEGPFCLTEGVMYDLVFVDSYGDGGLTFELYEDGSYAHGYQGTGSGNIWTFEAGNSGLPDNDSPCGAYEIIPNGPAVAMDNTEAIAQFIEPHPNGGGCGTPGFWCQSDFAITKTVWAYFIAQANTTYEITTCNESEGSFDTQLALYHAADCSDFSSFSLISSNDDMSGGCAVANGYSSRMFASCLLEGDVYYIQLDGWADASGVSNLTITTTTAAPTMNVQVGNVNCPLNKGEEANGSLTPYLNNSGVNFTTSWTGPAGFTSTENYPTGLQPGTYNLSLTDACGSSYSGSYTITQPLPWNIIVSSTGPQCETSSDGVIDLSVSGATAPYTYSWAALGGFTAATEDLTDLEVAEYQLIITDDNGCEWQQNYNLTAANSFSFDLGADTILCQEDDIVISGPAGQTYSWQDGSNNQFFLISGEDWPVGANSVILTATTELGCSYSDAFIFTVEDCILVDENENEMVQIWPNPVNDVINIALNKVQNQINLRLYDVSGKMVIDKVFNNTNQINTSLNIPAGLYTLNMQSDRMNWSKKILVQ
ncbi:MAG: T9SS type A sorting domain-containing protein [Flavobacteriales bacterium]|nr:T9SS type A sorting domain-containing protein [Flavobacteriales bacterium]